MSTAAPLQNKAAKSPLVSKSTHAEVLLQRKYACGSPKSSLTGECEECKGKTRLQAKLTVGASNDPLEQEADRMAERVMRMPVPENAEIRRQNGNSHIQRTCAPCSQEYSAAEKEKRTVRLSNLCPKCAEEAKSKIQRKSESSITSNSSLPDNFVSTLGAGQPLDKANRDYFEPRFGNDFSKVRIHSGQQAAASASSINALAYTFGNHVAFGAGQYQPESIEGRKLLAHELTHVVQQSGADGVRVGRRNERCGLSPVPNVKVQRQFITPLGQGGGYGGLMERDRRAAAAGSGGSVGGSASPYKVCARDLQGVLGYIGNHAYVEAPPYRYAIISPLCPASRWDNPVTGTTAQKWDNSPDPCGKTPHCATCNPAPGVTDVGACLRNAFAAYNALSLYRGTGPNSNTFAGTLARSCCAGMSPKPPIFGNVPGWDDAPAPARAGASPCPPGPTCG